jgi:hypothetical protein
MIGGIEQTSASFEAPVRVSILPDQLRHEYLRARLSPARSAGLFCAPASRAGVSEKWGLARGVYARLRQMLAHAPLHELCVAVPALPLNESLFQTVQPSCLDAESHIIVLINAEVLISRFFPAFRELIRRRIIGGLTVCWRCRCRRGTAGPSRLRECRHVQRGLRFPPRGLARGSVHLACALLASGPFLGILPRSLLRFGANLPPLKILPLELPMPPLPVGIMTVGRCAESR